MEHGESGAVMPRRAANEFCNEVIKSDESVRRPYSFGRHGFPKSGDGFVAGQNLGSKVKIEPRHPKRGK